MLFFVIKYTVLFATVYVAQAETKVKDFSSPVERQGALIQNLQSYHIDFPTVTNSEKSHLGYLTDHNSRRRRKRAINAVQRNDNETFHYKFGLNSEEHHLELKINHDLFGPNFKVERFFEDQETESNKMEEHCYLVGKTSKNYSVAISDCDGLFGVVATGSDMIYIEPLVNESFVDKAKLKGPGRPHLIYKQSELPKNDQRFGDLNMIRIAAANARRVRHGKPEIHFSYVKFINVVRRLVKLMWVDRSNRRTYFTTMLPNTDRIVNTFTSHKWVAVDAETNIDLLIGSKKVYTPVKNSLARRADVFIQLPRGVRLKKRTQDEIKEIIGAKYIESMIVADKSVVEFHGKNRTERYILALINIVSSIFKHASLGVDINYVLIRIVLLDKDPPEVKFKASDPNQNLITVCEYMNQIRKGRSDNDPYYHDHATYLTRKVFGDAAGYAPVYGMCHPIRSCTLNSEDGFPSTFIIAHEVGHSLGMEHDGNDQKCRSDIHRGSIMAPLVRSKLDRYFWSSCSRTKLMGSIRNFHCLDDKPSDVNIKMLPSLRQYPGFFYTPDDQCRFDFGANYTICRAFYRNPCKVLWCNIPRRHDACKSMRAPALEGTECAPMKWCINNKCVKRDDSIKLPDPIHGGWGKWKPWSNCSKQCGVGIQSRERKCNNPSPRYGGKPCVGNYTDQSLCNTKKCKQRLPLREENIREQCPLIGKKKDSFREWSYYDDKKVDLNCTFETKFCRWINLRSSDQQNWLLQRGPTKTKKTGPSVDHTKDTTRGQYAYFESSNPTRKGDKARLSTPNMAVARGCLSFWYHMYGGKAMGSFRLLKVNKFGQKILWSRNENLGDQWFQAHVDIIEDEINLYHIIFEAERDKSYLSDIALDDISFTVGPCKNGDNDADIKEIPRNPCIMTCTARGGRMRLLTNNPVMDGLRCYDNGSNDICIDGTCMNVGCDGVMNSEKEYDNCGVCGGDNTSCKKTSGEFTRTSEKDLKMLLHMPRGSSNIKVTKSPNSNYLLVLTVKAAKASKKDNNVINGYGKQSPPGIYYAAGTQYLYTVSEGRETIKSLGAVRRDIAIKLKPKNEGDRRESSISVSYEYYASSDVTGHKELVLRTEKPMKTTKATTTIPTTTTTTTKATKIATTTRKATVKTTTKVSKRTTMPTMRTTSSVLDENKVDTPEPVAEIKETKMNENENKGKDNKKKEKEKEINIRWVILDKWRPCSRSCGKGTTFLIYFCKRGNKIVPRTYCRHLELNTGPTFKYCNTHPCGKTYSWQSGVWGNCSKSCSVGLTRRTVQCVEQPGDKVVAEKFCEGVKPSVTKTCFIDPCLPTWTIGNWSECSTTCGVGTQTRSVFCTNDRGQRTNGCNEKSKPEERNNCQRPPCPTIATDPLDCDFEKGLCEWLQVKADDDLDWIRNNGKTKSSGTGPSYDNTLKSQKGHYLYVEASHRKQHLKAKLISPEISARHTCLKFYYHMYGYHSGTLEVKLLTKGGYMNELAWQEKGNQGDKWIEAQADISMGLSYKIVIEATLGTGWRGDLAIDDISFYKKECSKSPGNKLAGKIR